MKQDKAWCAFRPKQAYIAVRSPAENLKNASCGAVWVCGILVRPHRVGGSAGVKTGVFKITRIFEIGGKI